NASTAGTSRTLECSGSPAPNSLPRDAGLLRPSVLTPAEARRSRRERFTQGALVGVGVTGRHGRDLLPAGYFFRLVGGRSFGAVGLGRFGAGARGATDGRRQEEGEGGDECEGSWKRGKVSHGVSHDFILRPLPVGLKSRTSYLRGNALSPPTPKLSPRPERA